MTPMRVSETPGHPYCGNTIEKKWNLMLQWCHQNAIFKVVSKSHSSILFSNVGQESTHQSTRFSEMIPHNPYHHI
jgi:hypothetical protein